MDPNVKRLMAMQATNRFLIEVAYRSVLEVMPAEERSALLDDLRSPRSRVTTTHVAGEQDNAAAKAEIEAMVEADVLAFADRIGRGPSLRN